MTTENEKLAWKIAGEVLKDCSWYDSCGASLGEKDLFDAARIMAEHKDAEIERLTKRVEKLESQLEPLSFLIKTKYKDFMVEPMVGDQCGIYVDKELIDEIVISDVDLIALRIKGGEKGWFKWSCVKLHKRHDRPELDLLTNSAGGEDAFN